MWATRHGKSEQARPVKTVKVHMPIAKWGTDQTVGSPHGKLWEAPHAGRGGGVSNGRKAHVLMSGSLSTGSPAGHLNTRQRGVPVHGGSMYSQAHVNPGHRPKEAVIFVRVSMAPGGRRLLKRGKPRVLGGGSRVSGGPDPTRLQDPRNYGLSRKGL